MAVEEVPPAVTVVEMDVEKQVPAPAPEKPSEKDDKKKSAGVVVTVMHLGDDAAPDSEANTPVEEGVIAIGEKGDLEEAYPEGGLRAWLVVFGAWCGLFGSMG
jgi:hypothetical protein